MELGAFWCEPLSCFLTYAVASGMLPPRVAKFFSVLALLHPTFPPRARGGDGPERRKRRRLEHERVSETSAAAAEQVDELPPGQLVQVREV